MTCTSCGANLPPGATTCPTCGMPTPYNARGTSGQYDPTVAVPPPQYGNSPAPGTAYGSNPYGAPPSNQYDASGSNPYGTPMQQQPPYGTPPQQPPYGVPPQPYGVPQGGTFGQPPVSPPPKKSRTGRNILIGVGIGLLVLILACVGIFFVLAKVGQGVVTSVQQTATAVSNNSNTPITTATTPQATTGTGSGTAPSGLSIDPTSQSYLINPQMSSAVDSNYKPTTVTTTFKPNQDIYATFETSSSAPNGYAEAKWYDGNNKLVHTSPKPLQLGSGYAGYFTTNVYTSAQKGIVEMYWCTQSNCSDAQLAQVVSFTISDTTSFHFGTQSVAHLDMNKRRNG